MLFFFYGTLLDRDVQEIVLGTSAPKARFRPATLPNFRRATVCRGGYPVLVRCTGRRVQGQLVSGLDKVAIEAMGHFEGEDYEPLWMIMIEPNGKRTPALVFIPWRSVATTGSEWSLLKWQQKCKPRLLLLMRQWATEFGARDLRSCVLPWHIRRHITALTKVDRLG